MTRLPATLALTALLLVPAPSSAGTRPEIATGVRAALEELEAWDVSAARKIADGLAQKYAGDPAVQALEARLRFEEGDFAGAAALLDGLGAQANAEMVKVVKATHEETRGYASQESEHFIFLYRPGKDALLAPYALETLEKIRAAMQSDLGWAPATKLRVEVYDSPKAMARVSTLTEEEIKTSGTIALCKFNRLMIVSPKAMVHGYGWQDTLAHEYVHFVVSNASRNTVPIWIHEGLAKFLESRWRGAAGQALSPSSAGLLREAARKNKLIPFERMHPSMALLPSQEDAALAFAEVFTAIESLYARGGAPLLKALLASLKGGASYEEAIAKAAGTSFPRFVDAWRASLPKRPVPEDAKPLSVERLKFQDEPPKGKAKAKDAEDEQEAYRFGDFLEIEDKEGRSLAHLGDLLRQRKRPKAANDAFARAQARVGQGSPALSNAFAQTLIETGETARAEKLLLGSLRPYPSIALTHKTLGALYLKTGRLEDAERSFLQAIGFDPFDPALHAALLNIYTEQKRAQLAEREKNALQLLSARRSDAEPGTAVLTVKSHPNARVFLDGQDTGRSTPTELSVKPGAHVVRLVNEERGFERETKVEAAAGERKTVELSAELP